MSDKQTISDTRDHLLANLSWQVAERDDKLVAQAIHSKEPLCAVHTLEETGLLDGFFEFLNEAQIFPLLHVKIPLIQRLLIPIVRLVLLYILRILFGINSINALPN